MRLHDETCCVVIIKHVYNILLPLVITALTGRKGYGLVYNRVRINAELAFVSGFNRI